MMTNDMVRPAWMILAEARVLMKDLGGGVLNLMDICRAVRLRDAVVRELNAEKAKKARWDRVRRGMVAGWVDDMRAVGAWDGE